MLQLLRAWDFCPFLWEFPGMQTLPTPSWREQCLKISSITPAGTDRAACAFAVFDLFITQQARAGPGFSLCLSDADGDCCDNAPGTSLPGCGLSRRDGKVSSCARSAGRSCSDSCSRSISLLLSHPTLGCAQAAFPSRKEGDGTFTLQDTESGMLLCLRGTELQKCLFFC